MNRPDDRHPPAVRRSPEGGYRLIPVREIAAVWFLHRTGRLRFADIRAYLACQEAVARRCVVRSGKAPTFTPREILALTGGGLGRVTASLARLERCGVLSFSRSAIEFTHERLADRLKPSGFPQFLERFPNHDRLLPVPRRSLRLLCGGARASLAAMLLGHLVWGLYRDGQGVFRPVGRVRLSWISETFGMDAVRVEEARTQLIDIGWLIPEESGRVESDRSGAKFRINLSWKRGAPSSMAATGPSAAVPGAGSTPAGSDMEPPAGVFGDQKPACGGPPGVRISQPEGNGAGEAKPTLRHVVPEDLRYTRRLLELHDQAVDSGWVGPSESERLKWVAAAEHARVVGTTNPCGLFARLVRSKFWHYLTQDDEDAANRRLKAFLYGGPPSVKVPLPGVLGTAVRGGQGTLRPGLSEDARFVRDVTHVLRQRGVPESSMWRLVHRERPEWTQERWDRALGELSPGDSPQGR